MWFSIIGILTVALLSPSLQPLPLSLAAAATDASTDDLSSKAKADSTSKDYTRFRLGATESKKNSALLPKAKFDKNTDSKNYYYRFRSALSQIYLLYIS